MKKLKEILFDNMYGIELNGFALLGLMTASLYGVIYMIKDVISWF